MSAPEASMAACTSGGRESSPPWCRATGHTVHPHNLRTPRTAPPHTLSRTGGRLADDRSFGLWGGGAQAGGRGLHGNRGVSTVARRLSLCTLGASTLATGAARQLPAVTAAGPSSGLCGLAVTNPIMT